MKETITAFLLALSLLLCCLCSAQASALTRAEMYEAYQAELHRYLDGDDAMPLEELVSRFDELGNYKKSAFFSYYVSVLRDTEVALYDNLPLYMNLIRLDEDFCALLEEEEFPSADELEAYALGRQAEAADDWPAAIAHYEESIAVLDSVRRVARLHMAGPTATPTPVPTTEPTPTPVPTPTPAPTPTKTPSTYVSNVAAGDYTITTYAEGYCTITRYKGNARQLRIPEQLNGFRVTSINSSAFRNCTSLTSVTIPDSVTFIGSSAFYNCTSLTSITLPRRLSILYGTTFMGCSALESIVIPESVTMIEGDAFRSCSSLTRVTIPDSVTYISDSAFSKCSPQLTLVVKPRSEAQYYAQRHNLRFTTY